MLQKIISGGQTGADQAALDSAIKFNISHGGWIPKGRKTEHGVLPEKYKMNEMGTSDYPARTRQNIIDSDATLIIASAELSGGSRLTKKIAMEIEKPYCHIDFVSMDDFEAALIVHSFIVDNNVGVLNVAGPRLSSDPGIYFGTRNIIEAMIYMIELASDKGINKVEFTTSDRMGVLVPFKNRTDVVEFIASRLTLKTKSEIAALASSKIASLYYELSDYIMESFVSKKKNTDLFREYLKELGKSFDDKKDFFEPELLIEAGDFAMTIVKELKKFLEKDHLLRVVK